MFARVTHPRRLEAKRAAQILNQHPAQLAHAEVRFLISTVEDLVERLSTVAGPEVKRLRMRTAAALGVVALGMLAIGLLTGRAVTPD
jgi:hypothetical protein